MPPNFTSHIKNVACNLQYVFFVIIKYKQICQCVTTRHTTCCLVTMTCHIERDCARETFVAFPTVLLKIRRVVGGYARNHRGHGFQGQAEALQEGAARCVHEVPSP